MKIDLDFTSDASGAKESLDNIINKFESMIDMKNQIKEPLVSKEGMKETVDNLNEVITATETATKLTRIQRQEMERRNDHERIYAQLTNDSYKNLAQGEKIVPAMREQFAEREKLIIQIDKQVAKINELKRVSDQRINVRMTIDEKQKIYEATSQMGELRRSVGVLRNAYKEADSDFKVMAQAMIGGADLGKDKFKQLETALRSSTKETQLLTKVTEIYGSNGGTAIESIKQRLVESKTEGKRVAMQFRDIRNEMRQMAVDGRAATEPEKYKQLAKEANNIQMAMQQANYEISGMATGTGLKRTILQMQEVTSLASVLTGGMVLFGIENENVGKSLTRLNALMTIMNGLQNISTTMVQKDSIVRGVWNSVVLMGARNLGVLRGALIATGFGAVAVAIGYIVSQVMKWNDATKLQTEAQEKLNEQAKEFGAMVSSNANKELIAIEKLIRGINDETNTRAERLTLVEKMRSLYPAIFKDLSNEAILAGNVASAYNDVRKSIIDVALAQAFTKQAEKILDDYASSVGEVVRLNQQLIEGNKEFYKSTKSISDEGLFSAYQAQTAQIGKNLAGATKQQNDQFKILKLEVENRGLLTQSVGEVNSLLDIAQSYSKDINNNFEGVSKSTTKTKSNFVDILGTLAQLEKSVMFESLGVGLKQNLTKINEEYKTQIDSINTIERGLIKLGKLTDEEKTRIDNISKAIRDNWAKSLDTTLSDYSKSIIDVQSEINKLTATSDPFEELNKKYEESVTKIGDSLEKIEQLRKAYQDNPEKTAQIVKQEQDLIDAKLALNTYYAKQVVEIQTQLDRDRINNAHDFAQKQLEITKNIFGDSEDIKKAQIVMTETMITELGYSVEEIKRYLKDGGGVSVAQFFGISDDESSELSGVISTLYTNINREVESQKSSLQMSGGSVGGFIGAAIGKGLEEKLRETMAKAGQQIEGYLKDMMSSIFDAQKSALESQSNMFQNNIDLLKAQITEEKSRLDERNNMYEDDMASSYAIDQNRIKQMEKDLLNQEALKKEASEKIIEIEITQAKAEFAIQSATQAMNTATTISELIKGGAKATSAHSGIPFVGVALGLASAGAMFAGFIALRKKMEAMRSNIPSFADGGALDLQGKGHSHQSGGIGLYTQSGQKLAEYERNEVVYAINKKDAQRGHTMPLLDRLNNNDLLGMQMILSNLVGSDSSTSASGKNIKIDVKTDEGLKGGMNALVGLTRNQASYYTKNGYSYKKIGNKTTRIS